MVAYAIRFNVKEIVLFYPNTINNQTPNNSELSIIDELANNEEIQIKSFQLPIINFDLFDKDYKSEHSLKLDFEKTKEELIKAIKLSLIKK
tara:strand:- start:601 stop:873 length:273 start_codon:yes stop_codon:yes gene_type:complete